MPKRFFSHKPKQARASPPDVGLRHCKLVLKTGAIFIAPFSSLEEDEDGFIYGSQRNGRAFAFSRDNLDYAEEVLE